MTGGGRIQSSIFDEVAEVIGEDATRLLCAKLGGTSLYVPARPKADHPVALLLGETVARQLGERFGGNPLLLPRGRRTGDRARVLELRKTTHLTTKQIALATGYHVRQVCRILEEDAKSRQSDLFG